MENKAEYTSRQLLADLWSFMSPYKKTFYWGSFFRFVSDVVWLFPIWAVSEIITMATHYRENQSLTRFWWLMALIAAAAVIHFVGREIAKYLIYNVGEKMSVDARLKTIRHLFKLNLAWHENENTGNKMRRMTSGGDNLNAIVRLYVDLLVESTVNLVAISAVFFTLNPLLLAVLLFFFSTYYLLALKLTRQAKEQAVRVNQEWEKMDGGAYEAVNNILTVQSLNIGARLLSFLREYSKTLKEEIRKRVVKYRGRAAVLSLYQELFRQGVLLFTILQVFKGRYEVGVIALVLLYFGKIEASASEFAEITHQLITAKIGVARMKAILETPAGKEHEGKNPFPRQWQKIRLEKVAFSFQGRKVLNGLSLTIRRGEKIGIVGLSGAGKSTLFKLLLKLYADYEGTIKVDDLDLRKIRRGDYLQKTAVVSQETELFNYPLQDNITLKPALKPQEKRDMDRAIKIAHVKDFLFKLPQGLKSLVGEKGVRLSGGEKQRVGIARAIYRKPEILLMDEATSHLDVDSEKKIQEALHEFFRGTTAVVIAHRLSTLREMDRIVVIGEGRVTEEGSFEELQKKKGEFWRLWQKQVR